MGDLVPHRMPWDVVPVEDTVKALQRDMAYIVKFTAVMVHSNREVLSMCVNTPRGQIVPRGEVRFADGTTVEFQDIGAPQPGAPLMAVPELVKQVMALVSELGLGLPLP